MEDEQRRLVRVVRLADLAEEGRLPQPGAALVLAERGLLVGVPAAATPREEHRAERARRAARVVEHDHRLAVRASLLAADERALEWRAAASPPTRMRTHGTLKTRP